MKFVAAILLGLFFIIFTFSNGLLGSDTRHRLPKILSILLSGFLAIITLLAGWDGAVDALRKRGLLGTSTNVTPPAPEAQTSMWTALIEESASYADTISTEDDSTMRIGCDVGASNPFIVFEYTAPSPMSQHLGEAIYAEQGRQRTSNFEFVVDGTTSFFIKMQASGFQAPGVPNRWFAPVEGPLTNFRSQSSLQRFVRKALDDSSTISVRWPSADHYFSSVFDTNGLDQIEKSLVLLDECLK